MRAAKLPHAPMDVKSLPTVADPAWLQKQLGAVSVKKAAPEVAELANAANDPASGDAYLRGEELSQGLFRSLQQANGETGDQLTLKNPDGTLTRAGELYQKLEEAKATRDGWFDAPKPGAMLYVDMRDVDLGFFRGNDASGKPIHVTGAPSSTLTVYWGDAGPTHLVPPSSELGVLYHERGESVDLQRSGNTSLNDPAASLKSELDAPGAEGSDVPDDLKAKNLNRDPSTVRRELAAAFFRDALHVPTQRMAPVKWFANGWYQGLRTLEEPLDRAMWTRAVQSLDPGREVPEKLWIFKAQWTDGADTLGGGHLDKADLRYHRGADGDDGANQYRVKSGEQTYALKTGGKQADEAYGELAAFVRTVNGIGLKDDAGQPLSDSDPNRFNTEAYRKAVEGSMDVYEILRTYAGLVLAGAWDNLINPSNFAWVAEKSADGKARWSALPLDLDSSFGIGWDGQPQWQDLDLLLRSGPTENVPVIWKNLLANDHFKAYVLDYVEHLANTEFTPEKLGAQADALWQRNATAVFHESDTPTGPTHTQRPFSNDTIHKHNRENLTVHQDGLNAIPISTFVAWRRASALWQLGEIRQGFTQRSGVDFAHGQLVPA